MATVSAEAQAATPPGERMNKLGLGLLSLGHGTVDLCQGGLPVLLPFLFQDLGLTYTTAAFVVTMANLTSSVIQPGFGYVADQMTHKWLLPAGCFIACACLAVTSQAPSYPVLLLLVALGSLGIAMYHPEAARSANSFAGDRKASGMSIFAVGGNLGFVSAPLLLGLLLDTYGRSGALWLFVPAVAVPVLFLIAAPWLTRAHTPKKAAAITTERPSARRPMAILISVIACRQWAQTSLLTFIPLYFYNHLGEPFAIVNQLLAALLGGTVVGTLIGGQLADRFGRKPVITVSLAISAPLLLLFLNAPGPLRFLMLFLAGATLIMTLYTTVVMAQELMPDRTALAAGLTLGFGVGLGGLGAALLGRIADTFGIGLTMTLICGLPLLGSALSLALTDTLRRPAKA